MKSSARCIISWLACAAVLEAVPVTALAFRPDGSALVSTSDRALDVRSPKNAAVQHHIECSLANINTLAFSPDGQLQRSRGHHNEAMHALAFLAVRKMISLAGRVDIVQAGRIRRSATEDP